MKQEQVLDHVIGLVDHFKRKKDDGELTSGDAGIYLKCLTLLGAKEAVMSLNQIESLSDKVEVLDLPFEVKNLG